MKHGLVELGRVRYVGDTATGLVHDRWHKDSQGCGLDETVQRGHAVGFEPDTLDGALFAGYEYCEACHDKTDPDPPSWARLLELPDEGTGEDTGEDRGGTPVPDAVSDREGEVAQHHVPASRREKETAKATG